MKLGPIKKEEDLLLEYKINYPLSINRRKQIVLDSVNLVEEIRTKIKSSRLFTTVADKLLNIYSLSSPQGYALIELSEALLRTPDIINQNRLIIDKLGNKDWRLVAKNPSFVALIISYCLRIVSSVLSINPETLATPLRTKLFLPCLRWFCKKFVMLLANQFVISETLSEVDIKDDNKYLYSFDMLGEEARTNDDAVRYYELYSASIIMCSSRNNRFNTDDCYKKDNVSVKLSALYPRYETRQYASCLESLYPKLLNLCILAKKHGLSLTIDAEEMDRLELSLGLISKLLTAKELVCWSGLGIVVQAYGKRALNVIEYLYKLASKNDRKISIRLVKGAYWDKEIKVAQEKGLNDFPVFTQKHHTDISYIYLASKLLDMNDRIFAQFASHNANTILSVLELVEKKRRKVEVQFELQRILGMGKELHDIMIKRLGKACRVYAPIGNHNDLLPYLLRRILENGVNSSFIHQISDTSIDPKEICYDPYIRLHNKKGKSARNIRSGSDIFLPERKNSKSINLDDFTTLLKLDKSRQHYENIDKFLAKELKLDDIILDVDSSPNKSTLIAKTELNVKKRVKTLKAAQLKWQKISLLDRAKIFNKAADLFEKNQSKLFAILAKEGGKTIDDSLSEIREAIDFIRFYSYQLSRYKETKPRGIVLCIAPWNFPLAIFCGQVVAALLTGNAVIAKPSENCPKVAKFAISLIYSAGVPKNLIQFTAASGSKVSQVLIAKSYLDMIVFTGSNKTATSIMATIANSKRPEIPFIAETGGLNCMIVDSTCLLERAVDDIISSAFHSAGQRCSALRLVYVQEEIAHALLDMLKKATNEQSIGDPWFSQTDIAAIITKQAAKDINQYIQACSKQKRLIWQFTGDTKQTSSDESTSIELDKVDKLSSSKLNINKEPYVTPTIIKVAGIAEMKKEIFGPVLHFATFKASSILKVVDDINESGYGLTFGLQTRNKVVIQEVSRRIKCGNVYVNRNQIGAVVGSQPFGGMGLSGTGPKVGGSLYLNAFTKNSLRLTQNGLRLPSPVGETNIYDFTLKNKILIIGNDLALLKSYLNFIIKALSLEKGAFYVNSTLNDRVLVRLIAQNPSSKLLNFVNSIKALDIIDLEIVERNWQVADLNEVEAICFAAPLDDSSLAAISKIKKYLCLNYEKIIPVIVLEGMSSLLLSEKLICSDITVSGGNLELLTSEID